jgi:hypothetical protein
VVATVTAVVPGVAGAGTPSNDVPGAYQGQGPTGARWAKNQYLSTKKPTPTSYSGGRGIFSAPSPLKSSRESRLKPDTIRDQRAVYHRYPLAEAFHRPRDSVGYCGEGRNLACMITDSTMDWNMAKWVGATTTILGVSEVIYRRTSGRCRGFGGLASDVDRGSPAVKQMDNVYASACCDSGTAS